MVTAIGVEDPLHDDLAALMLEVDIDVRWFAAFFRHETFKQQVVSSRVYGRNAQDKAHSRIGG